MEKTHLKENPLYTIFFFILLVGSLVFFQSQKILLWQEKNGNGKRDIVVKTVLAGAFFSEKIKNKLGWGEFFLKEHNFWLKLKTSPIVFQAVEGGKNLMNDEKLPLSAKETTEEKPAQASTQVTSPQTSTEPTSTETVGQVASTQTSTGSTSTKITVQPTSTQPTGSEILMPAIQTSSEVKLRDRNELKILVVGDSLVAAGGGLGEMLEKTLKKEFNGAKILREGKVSSGLARPDYFDWGKRIPQLISQFRPDLALVLFGTNDGQALTAPSGAVVVNYINFGKESWDEEYARRVDKILEIFQENDIFVFWIGLPIMKDKQLSQRMSHLNVIYEREIGKFNNAQFIPIWCILCDERGNYKDYVIDEKGVKRLTRTADGVHFQFLGGKIIAENIVETIKNTLKKFL